MTLKKFIRQSFKTAVYLLSITFSTLLFAAVTSSNTTSVDFTIKKNGEIIHNGSVMLMDGKEATLALYDKKTNTPSSRMIIRSEKTSQDKEDTLINLQLNYQQYAQGKWISVANTSMQNKDKQPGSIEIFSDNSAFEISVIASSKNNKT